MTVDEIVRAWRDPDFAEALSAEARKRLPENPAGTVAVLDRELAPSRTQGLGDPTCVEACGDTCPPGCNFSCETDGMCCC